MHCCITSPPYWGLRDYGLSEWKGGDPECPHTKKLNKHKNLGATNASNSLEPWPGGVCGHCGARKESGIGLEPTLSEWLENIVAVGREVWRVLRDDGTWWLNLGDAYAGSGKGGGGDKQSTNKGSETGRPHRALVDGKRGLTGGGVSSWTNRDVTPGKRTPRGPGSGRWGMGDTAVDGLPAKNLMMQPQRAAMALQDDGWIVRSEIVWHKPNPMPESVSDRPTSAHEKIYLLVKQPRYFYDAEAVRQPHTGPPPSFFGNVTPSTRTGDSKIRDDFQHTGKRQYNPAGANLRNVWTIPTQGRPQAHFATFPDDLPKRCILAGTSEYGVCADCGAPWVRQVSMTDEYKDWKDNHSRIGAGTYSPALGVIRHGKKGGKDKDNIPPKNQTIGWQPMCECNAGDCPVHGKPDKQSGHGPRHAGFNARWKANGDKQSETTGWQPTCTCSAKRVPATVLDPFVGSGTTLAMAQTLGRRGIGIDLNPEYLEIARTTIEKIPMPIPVAAYA